MKITYTKGWLIFCKRKLNKQYSCAIIILLFSCVKLQIEKYEMAKNNPNNTYQRDIL